jgi:micrococcal nuclease
MLQRFICCLKPKNVSSYTNCSSERNISSICVRIAEDTPFADPPILFETRSLFDSNEWLNNLDKNIDWKDTVQFVPPVENGIVIKVYDGDTITIASKLPYRDSLLYRFSVRLNGIDCPEIKGKNEFEKECAQIAKDEVTKLTLNKVVNLKNIQTEKYGRILADVYIDELHLNKHMLEKRLAVSYDGGTKNIPRNWMDYYRKGEM